jgi:hypothetical protein
LASYSAEFVPPLLKAMHNARELVGTDPLGTERSRYLQIVKTLVLVAMILKIIQDLHPGVVTDAVLAQRLAIALDTGPGGDKSGWPGWVLLQVAPEDLAQYGATEADNLATLQAKIAAYESAPH